LSGTLLKLFQEKSAVDEPEKSAVDEPKQSAVDVLTS